MRGNARARDVYVYVWRAIATGWGCGAGRSDSTAVQRDQGVEMCARGPCATTAACSWRRACAMTRDSDGHGAFVSGCAAQGVPCKRAGRRAARKARSGSMHRLRRSAPCARGAAVLPTRVFARRHEQAGCWKISWLVPGCGVQFVEESGAGVAGAGCDGAESAADAVSAAPPSETCGGGAWPWAAHPRVAMVERVPSASVIAFAPRPAAACC